MTRLPWSSANPIHIVNIKVIIVIFCWQLSELLFHFIIIIIIIIIIITILNHSDLNQDSLIKLIVAVK